MTATTELLLKIKNIDEVQAWVQEIFQVATALAEAADRLTELAKNQPDLQIETPDDH